MSMKLALMCNAIDSPHVCTCVLHCVYFHHGQKPALWQRVLQQIEDSNGIVVRPTELEEYDVVKVRWGASMCATLHAA